jgi:hypothetical protein
MLEAEAKRLYEEGLVYDGLGDRETAKARWRAVLETMPLQDNEYYRKAAAKLALPRVGRRPMRVEAFGITDKGLIRDNNEDAFSVDVAAGLFFVGDGMGGLDAGEVASGLALKTVAGV